MIPVKIIGIGLSPDDITVKQEKIINNANLLIGGTEQLKVFKNLNTKKLEIKNNLSFIVENIQKDMNSSNIVVLASGDPLFYGIGSYLIKKIGKENVKIYSNVSSVAKAFSKINEPWQNAQLLSLHGDRSKNILKIFGSGIVSGKKMFCLLTDKKKDPAWIAQKIIDKKDLSFTMCVLERLETKEEKITWFEDLTKIKENKFLHPNIVILKKTPSSPDSSNINQIYIGMEDHNFFCEKGLITKSEIRSIVLSKLNFVSKSHIFWDLGAGSGSVSIEASSLIPKGSVYAVEKNTDRINLIKSNISHFNTQNIKVIHAQLPDGLEKMPNPDRIFIGGGGKDLKTITEYAINKLLKNGIIVVNTVLIQNLESVATLMKDMGLKTKSISVQISRSKSMPYGDRFESLNPVWIIFGKKDF
ncbi:MAG: precorrin-6y C5,15-methyltransferase (decarboxylating) subunit CbiE [Desulfobacteraceae bacterium]|nr:precorrin-6y C5,15-methyltransferase (decarboxylating) subunit CbiE [Desulfobacteraceae bacterium]